MKTIYLHGLGQTAKAWDKVITNPQDEVVLDMWHMLGTREYSYENLYKVIKEFLEPIDGEVNLVGLSLGAVVALNYALDFKDKVNTLVLVGVNYRYLKKPRIENFIISFLPRSLEEKMGISKENLKKMKNSLVGLDFTDRLTDISATTVVICGERDTPRNKSASKIISEQIPQAQLQWVPEAEHHVNEENPEALKKMIQTRLQVDVVTF